MPNISKHEHTFVTNIMAELSPSSSGFKITPAPKALMQGQVLAVLHLLPLHMRDRRSMQTPQNQGLVCQLANSC